MQSFKRFKTIFWWVRIDFAFHSHAKHIFHSVFLSIGKRWDGRNPIRNQFSNHSDLNDNANTLNDIISTIESVIKTQNENQMRENGIEFVYHSLVMVMRTNEMKSNLNQQKKNAQRNSLRLVFHGMQSVFHGKANVSSVHKFIANDCVCTNNRYRNLLLHSTRYKHF